MVLCVDPGLRGCGCALFEGTTLVRAMYVRNSEKVKRGAEAWRAMADAVSLAAQNAQCLIIETQIIRPFDTRAIHGSIMEIQGVAGAIVGLFSDMTVGGYTPSEWKGTVKGDIMTERIKERMTSEEKKVFESSGKTVDHNIYDAVGLGYFHLGRLSRNRVYAR